MKAISMKSMSLLLILLCFSPLSSSSEEENITEDKPSVHHPVILIPGLGGSRIEARLNKPSTVSWYCSKKADWFTLWVNPTEFLPSAINCFIDNFRRVFNSATGLTENAPGVETRVPGFGDTDSVGYLTSFKLGMAGYFADLISSLEETLGYQGGHSIRGAPYDFRLAPYENEQFFVDFKSLIEETYLLNGNKKVVLICHSMGCLYSHYFLIKQSQEWKDKYTRAWITVGAPFGGVVKSVSALAGGEGIGGIMFWREELRELQRSFSSIAFLLPVGEVFGDKVIFSMNDGQKVLNYTARDMEKILTILNDTAGYEMWKRSKDLITHYEHPGIDVHCVVGTKKSTTELIRYTDPKNFPNSPELLTGDGDGSVNSVSADLCLKWASGNTHKQYSYQHFEGIGHIKLIRNKAVIDYIISEIREMSETRKA